MQPIEVILACSHKISRKGRYRKASERILTEKGEEKVDVTLYIKAGFRIGFLLFLLSAAWQDLRKKSIRASTFYIWGMMGLMFRGIQILYRLQQMVCEETGKSGEEIFWSMAVLVLELFLDLFPGLLLLGISVVTEEAMGKGDGWFFLVSGLFLGFWKNVFLLTGGLFLCFPVAVWLMIGRWGKNCRCCHLCFRWDWGCCFCEKTGKYYSRSSLCYGGCFIFPGSAYRKCRTDP